jgi:hypothetical protein
MDYGTMKSVSPNVHKSFSLFQGVQLFQLGALFFAARSSSEVGLFGLLGQVGGAFSFERTNLPAFFASC